MSKTINSDLIRGNINTIILKSLYDGDRYGYDIIREIEEKSHGQYILKQPTLYSCLKRLESQGFINSYWGEQSNGGRRKYYTLTDMGREVFVKNQDEYEFSRTIIDQLISERDYDLDSIEKPSVSHEDESSPEVVDAYEDIETDIKAQPAFNSEIQSVDEEKTTESEDSQNNQYSLNEEAESCEETQETISYEKNEVEADGAFVATQNANEENSKYDSVKFEEKSEDDKPEEISYSSPSKVIDEMLLNENGDESYSYNLKNTKPVYNSAGNGGKVFNRNDDVYENNYSFSPSERYGFAFDDESSSANEQAATLTSAPETAEHKNSVTDEFLSYNSDGFYDESNDVKKNDGAAANYKSILSDLVEDFDVPQNQQTPQEKLTKDQIIAESNLSVKEQIKVRNFGKLSQSIRELGEEVKIRTPDSNAVREFNKQYYYYRNKLLLFQYGILFLIMLVECFLTFIIVKNTTTVSPGYDIALYVCSILFCFAFPITAAILYLSDPSKRKRIDFNFKNSIIFRLIIMAQLMLIIYALNVYAGMPIGGDPYYALSMALPMVLSTNVPVNSIIFNALYRTNKFAVE